MRAAGLDYESRCLAEFQLPDPPPPGPGEALLEIVEVGICATDRELAHFHFGRPPAGETRLTLGHEALARVAAVGPGSGGFQSGELVVPMIREACPTLCRGCGAGRMDLCETGAYRERGIVGWHGYLTSYAVDQTARLVRVPSSLAELAVLLEPLSVVEKAMEAAWRAAPLPPRQATVFGAGPVGLLTVLALLARGVEVTCRSLEAEDHPRALLAREAGARYEVASAPLRQSHLVFEVSGSPQAGRAAFDALGPSGVLVLVGASDFDIRFPGIRAVVENQTIVGVVNASAAHFQAALLDLARFDVRLVRRLIQRQPWASWQEAVALQGSTAAIKTVLPLH
jgi:threonine dehydrogenase-like Zn-dependent dehydrogenase